MTIEGHQSTGARCLALERLEESLGVEGVEPELGVDEEACDAEALRIEQRPAGPPLHDEEGAAQNLGVGARKKNARCGKAQVRESVLGGALAQRSAGIVKRGKHPQNERPRQSRRRSAQAHSEDLRIEAAAERNRRLDKIEARTLKLCPEIVQEARREISCGVADRGAQPSPTAHVPSRASRIRRVPCTTWTSGSITRVSTATVPRSRRRVRISSRLLATRPRRAGHIDSMGARPPGANPAGTAPPALARHAFVAQT